jgi:hypothetical protein
MMPGKAAPSPIGLWNPYLLWMEMASRLWEGWRDRSPYGRALTEAERVFWQAQLELLRAMQAAVTARLGQLGAEPGRPTAERIRID